MKISVCFWTCADGICHIGTGAAAAERRRSRCFARARERGGEKKKRRGLKKERRQKTWTGKTGDGSGGPGRFSRGGCVSVFSFCRRKKHKESYFSSSSALKIPKCSRGGFCRNEKIVASVSFTSPSCSKCLSRAVINSFPRRRGRCLPALTVKTVYLAGFSLCSLMSCNLSFFF